LEVVVTLVLLLVGLGAYIRANPITLAPSPDNTAYASAPETRRDGSVLVVVAEVPEAQSFATLAFDQMWLNAVEQEVGSVRVVTTSALTRSAMDPCEWVIIPRAAAAQLDPTQSQFVRNWVEDGGVVLLEQPEGPWQSFTGQAFTGTRARETRRMTSFDGAVTRGELREDILQSPFRTTLFTYNPSSLARGRDYHVLMEVDGAPGIIHRSLGRGAVIVLLFDLGSLLGRMQQGQPEDDFRIPLSSSDALAAGHTVTARLVMDPALAANLIPYADIIERNVLYLMDTHRPLGRLWLYPGSRRGALLVTHSEGGFGPRTEFMTRWEHEAGNRSTVFAVPGSIDPEGLARLSRLSSDLQLQAAPVGSDLAPYRTWGIRNFRPIRRTMNLSEQVERLNHDLVPYGPLIANRALDAQWRRDYFQSFRELESLGIVMDLTYGPSEPGAVDGEESIGYLFGTGYPFRPIDATGRRFRLMELPVVINDAAAGYSVQRVRRLIVDSAERYHTTIVGDWRPDTMAVRPSFDALEAWRASFQLAESQELWVTTVAEFADFIQRREASSVDSTFAREERRLTIDANLVGPRVGVDDVINHTPALAFPARYDGRPIERMIVNGFATDTDTLALSGDRALHMLPLEPGEHRVQIFYAGPTDPSQSPP